MKQSIQLKLHQLSFILVQIQIYLLFYFLTAQARWYKYINLSQAAQVEKAAKEVEDSQ